ncbi:MAG TPA: hypothetical protein VIM71_11445 [Lacunisphaera sp.]
MKPAGFLLLLPAGLATVALTAEPSAGLVSREIKARIREGLPTYQPPSPKAGTDNESTATAQTSDPNVLILPKFMVKEKRFPRDADDHLMSKRDFNRKMENLYLDKIAEDGPLNVLLNSFTIPLLSPSKVQRGRALYRAAELDRLNQVNEISKSIDPEAARKYQQEMDNTHTTRPAGIEIRH